ncbi:hypothetical protein BYT27DRAFT_7279095 [Phlegmacium glaucopus]|nr:hypothetical protein BYT27DRAFT_7279095 [Phlegmacium glaucopus]
MAAEVIAATPHGATLSVSAENRSIDLPGGGPIFNDAYGRHSHTATPHGAPLSARAANGSINSGFPGSKIPSLVVVSSSGFERYERDFKSEKLNHDSFPLLMNFTEPELPNQWYHPDDAPYFLDDSRKQRRYASILHKVPILTDVWMYDADSKTKLETYIEHKFSYIEIPERRVLYWSLGTPGECGYYLVNHAKRCLFWLD